MLANLTASHFANAAFSGMGHSCAIQWPDTRRQYVRDGLRYASDMTEDEWALIEPFMPLAGPIGRPRTVELRSVVNAILYIASTGCQWRQLPKDFPPYSTVQGYFYSWSRRCRRVTLPAHPPCWAARAPSLAEGLAVAVAVVARALYVRRVSSKTKSVRDRPRHRRSRSKVFAVGERNVSGKQEKGTEYCAGNNAHARPPPRTPCLTMHDSTAHSHVL